MYNAYFGFKEAPFSIAPDPRYLYMTGQHRDALAHLVYGFFGEGGCILLTGEVGTGKTTVCRCLLEQIPEEANIALVLNPKVTAIELLETICDELKITYPQFGNTVKTYVDLINKFLIKANARGEKTVLILDEAQNLDSTVLEQLRLLTNLETNQHKLLQIIILGQPELLEILARNEMRQLAQRITARFHLHGLSRGEVKAYVTHRLAIAGQNAQLFPEASINKLYRLSNGIPRLINILCDRALLGAFVQNKQNVDPQTLTKAAKEVFGELKTVQTKLKLTGWMKIATIVTSVAIASILVIVLLQRNDTVVATEIIQHPSTEESMAVNNTISDDNKILVATNQAVEPSAFIADSFDEPIHDINFSSTKPGAESQNEIITPLTKNNTADHIDAFIRKVGDDNKMNAYSALLKTWDHSYPGTRTINACNFAREKGLKCLHSRGNLNSLRKLNRPAVLRLYTDDGKLAHAILSKLHDGQATLNTGTDSFTVDVTQLESHWIGEYTLLWQTPPYYKAALQPGNSGPIVQWLDQQFARLYGQEKTPTIHGTYSDSLVANVKKFQQSKGLIPDGVAGPHTFIHLNNAIGAKTPMLDTWDS